VLTIAGTGTIASPAAQLLANETVSSGTASNHGVSRCGGWDDHAAAGKASAYVVDPNYAGVEGSALQIADRQESGANAILGRGRSSGEMKGHRSTCASRANLPTVFTDQWTCPTRMYSGVEDYTGKGCGSVIRARWEFRVSHESFRLSHQDLAPT